MQKLRLTYWNKCSMVHTVTESIYLCAVFSVSLCMYWSARMYIYKYRESSLATTLTSKGVIYFLSSTCETKLRFV